MTYLAAAALRLNEAEITLQYFKFALVVFCAALPLRACIAVWFDHRNWTVLLPGAIWLALVTAFVLLPLASFAVQPLVAALAGLALAWIAVPRRWLTEGAVALQLPGIVAAVGAISLMTIGALP